jgi:hypothetical protein
MSVFSILHLWAFPWRPYTLANQEISGDPEYVGGKIIYQGGPLGFKAYLNAFNPMDMMKAVGRGFRWLFVGRKTRLQDPSYMDPSSAYSLKPDGNPPSMPGPPYAAYGEPEAVDKLGARPPGFSEENEELLAHAQSNPAGDIGLAASYYEAPDAPVSHDPRYQRPYHDEPALRPVSPQPYHAYQPQSTPYSSQPLQQLPPVSSPHMQGQQAPPAYTYPQDYQEAQMPLPDHNNNPYLPPHAG